MKEYYKIMNYSSKGPMTLYHANNGSRIIKMKEWIYASKFEDVRDGSSGTIYKSGWHVFDELDEAKKYLESKFTNLVGKIIVKCYIMGEIRPKLHSKSNIWLAQIIYLDEIIYLHHLVGSNEGIHMGILI